jgi:hypothetical protein
MEYTTEIVFDSTYATGPNVTAMWLTFLLCILEVLGSNLDLETGYPDSGFSWFPSVPPVQFWDGTSN